MSAFQKHFPIYGNRCILKTRSVSMTHDFSRHLFDFVLRYCNLVGFFISQLPQHT